MKLKSYFYIALSLLATWTTQVHATLTTFYTDDTPYYHRLYQDGLEIRFRVALKECNEVLEAELLFKNSKKSGSVAINELNSRELKTWPQLYQIELEEYCWYGARLKGQDLNDALLYSLKIKTPHGERFLNAETDSLLPEKRLKDKIVEWNTPGSIGSTPVIGGGSYFKIWEPEAERVDLGLSQNKKISLKTPLTQQKLHYIYLPQVKEGDSYTYHFVKNGKYEVLEVGNNKLMSSIKVDPMAKRIGYDKKGGSINGYVNPHAIVTGLSNYNWKNDRQISQLFEEDIHPWLIYQLWPLTFNPKQKNGKFVGGTFNDIQEKADYLSDLGITSVEFLPVHESRFHASWGYALDSLTLIEKNYGTPDDLRGLIDNLHQRELKVIFDVVINHVNNSLIREPLSKTRFNTKYYRGNTPWGPKPDFKNVMVRKWIIDSLITLVRDYHLDGLRFDMIETVYIGSKAGYQFVQELNTLLKRVQPKIYLSAEQLPDNAWATFPIKDNGLGFDSQWNDKFKNFFELKFDHYNENNRHVDLSPIKGSLMGFSNHDSGNGEYHFGGATRTLNYLGSHDFVGNKNPLMRIISTFESYESSGENYFFRVRPLEIPNKAERERKFRLIHNEFNHNTSLTSYGILFTKPGAAMFFQGEELAADLNIENEWSYINARENNSIPTVDVDIDRYVRSHRVQWENLTPYTSPELSFLSNEEKESFKRYHNFFKELIKFRREFPGVDLNDAQDVKECAKGILCYRLDRGPREQFVLVNYGYNIQDTWVNFPGTATDYWHETLSLANPKYSSGQKKYLNIISNLGGRANNIRLPGPGIAIFSKSETGGISDGLYFRSNLNGWQAKNSLLLKKASDRGDLYMTEVAVTFPQEVSFKIGTDDWAIELGAPRKEDTSSIYLDPTEGFLSYVPDSDNAKQVLTPGHYHFLFNIKDFKYRFLKVKDL